MRAPVWVGRIYWNILDWGARRDPLGSRDKPIPRICVTSNQDDSAPSCMNGIQCSQLPPERWLFSFRDGVYQGPSYWSVGHSAAAVLHKPWWMGASVAWYMAASFLAPVEPTLWWLIAGWLMSTGQIILLGCLLPYSNHYCSVKIHPILVV